ncbi:MAG: putative Fanconi anemia group J protein, partial [Streblomastix strix]
MTDKEFTQNIQGYEVRFPCKPYSSQKLIMDRLLKSLQTQTNGLLESPTGTGKTLALLCGACAFQEFHKKKTDQPQDNIKQNYQDDNELRPDIEDIIPEKTEEEQNNEINEKKKASKQKTKANKYPKIMYFTRTHSQIKQIVEELKRTSYNPTMSILASRSHLCINQNVRRSANPKNECM